VCGESHTQQTHLAAALFSPATSSLSSSTTHHLLSLSIIQKKKKHKSKIANISRIMKKGLPASAKIAKDSKECVQECISEFLSFVTSEASDKCQREKRKTINGDDLLWAMSTLGFEDYVEPLKVYLAKYREAEKAALPSKAGGAGGAGASSSGAVDGE
jgi:nuclear transcription Y subunit beta